MYTKIAEQSIANVARSRNVSMETVIQEMNGCIRDAMQDPDPLAQVRWQRMFGIGKIPTAIEFLAYIAEHPLDENVP